MLEYGNDSLSSILGWVSIACWIIVYSPQIFENYQLKSGEGLSVVFVVIWLIGDLCNLVGATLGGLLPTVIILAIYYSLCDVILLTQIYYYRWAKRYRRATLPDSDSSDAGEQAPLLDGNARLVPERESSLQKLLLQYAAAILFIFAFGVVAWWSDDGIPKDEEHAKPSKAMAWRIQVIGWTSAVAYLGARIPQIIKNFDTHCRGLSPALFICAIAGNVTYALSICAESMEREYLIRNASWLAGSALTVFLDIFVIFQFVYYRSVDRRHMGITS